MLHHTTSPGNHWGVSINSCTAHVLVQVQEQGNQARIPVTPEQAEDMASELLRFAGMARGTDAKEAQRSLFEAYAAPMGFDLTRRTCAAPEPWSEYACQDTGYFWAGWLANAGIQL